MIDWLAAIFLLLGSVFVLIAATGVNRLPDSLSRMHAATKAGAFGTSLMLVSALLFFGSLTVLVKALLVIVFFYTTAPIAAHLLGRAAYWRYRDKNRLEVDQWAEQPRQR